MLRFMLLLRREDFTSGLPGEGEEQQSIFRLHSPMFLILREKHTKISSHDVSYTF